MALKLVLHYRTLDKLRTLAMATANTCTTSIDTGFGLQCKNACGTRSIRWTCGPTSATVCGTCFCNNVTTLTFPCPGVAASSTLSVPLPRTSTVAGVIPPASSAATLATTTSAPGLLSPPDAAATSSAATDLNLPGTGDNGSGNGRTGNVLDSGSSSGGPNIPVIAGSIAGGIVLLACVAGLLWYRKSRKESDLHAGWRSSVRYEDTSYGRHAKKSGGGSTGMVQMAQMFPEEDKRYMPQPAVNADHFYGANGVPTPAPAYAPAPEPVDADAIPYAYAAYSESPVPVQQMAATPQAPAPVATQQNQSQYYYQQNYQQQSYDNYASYDYQRDYYAAPPPQQQQQSPAPAAPVATIPDASAYNPGPSYEQNHGYYAQPPAQAHGPISPTTQAAQTFEDIRSKYASVYSVAPGRQ
ncbi:hypothetical protein BJ742DRAFT_383218 [Cladochytrium replicatum]|nr:hypothetical protein BJ742DRAFT_383218 [Cladochytrium replicatum]